MSEKVALQTAISKVTTDWTRYKRQVEREKKHVDRRRAAGAVSRQSIREVAFEVMEEAYQSASGNGRFLANARQIYYAARPLILEGTGKSRLDSTYFTQTLLKDYLEDARMTAEHWRIAWDARGHFAEPHSGVRIDLGGVQIERYLRGVTKPQVLTPSAEVSGGVVTHGPEGAFAGVLFIEKEGFAEILEDARIQDRFDLAMMSTKGVPTKAACDILAGIEHQVTVYVLHDFDKAGFKILKTLREGVRLATGVDVVDLGFRIDDVDGLQSEPVFEQGNNNAAYLRSCGATDAEVKYLIDKQEDGRAAGRRVELNAMTSDQLVHWLETKLRRNRAGKVIPQKGLLEEAYRASAKELEMKKAVQEFVDGHSLDGEHHVPEDLRARVKKILDHEPFISWRTAIDRVAALEEDIG